MVASRAEIIRRLATAVRKLATETDVEALARTRPAGADDAEFESLDRDTDPETGLQKVLAGREDELSEAERLGLEAIIMPRGRPVAFIRDGTFDDLEEPWLHLNEQTVRARIEPLFAAIGRVELPNSPRIPYGGTGFIVGDGLLMTNRHVAELFTDGSGSRRLIYQAGDAAVHFRRHMDDPDDDRRTFAEVKKVLMIHPYWDMALLQVDGLPMVRPLSLSVEPPEDLVDREIVAVGYPARDDRNDLEVQDRIFQRAYGVIPYAAMSETSSKSWNLSVINVFSWSAWVVDRPSSTSWMAARNSANVG